MTAYRPPDPAGNPMWSSTTSVHWGHVDEFLRRLLRKHYPVLRTQVGTGKIRDVRIEQPPPHSPEADRSDYRVTLTFANVLADHDKTHERQIARGLFLDRESFRPQRFALLLAHWDLPVIGVRPQP
jgi:hypothetical protein